jgi:hypothetical protein
MIIAGVLIGDPIYWPLTHTTLITTTNYNSLSGLHALKITVTAAHIFFYVFTSRFLVTASDNVLCLRPYRLVNILQLTHCSNCLTPRPAAISRQPSVFTDSNSSVHCTALHCTLSLIAMVITSRYEPHRKLRSSVAVQLLLIRNNCLEGVVYRVITQQRFYMLQYFH